MASRIVILATGGTIAGQAPDASRSLQYTSGVMGVEQLVAAVPGLADAADLTCEQIANIGSENMSERVWLDLAAALNRYLADPGMDGAVVLHGTDTMEETAYFLNLTVASFKPVVLTGAMRPANALSADGPVNILNAVQLAASAEAAGKGVLVCLNGSIAAAREVTKTNTADPATFKTPVFGELGYILDGKPAFCREPVRLRGADSEFSLDGITELPRVEIIYGHAGQRPDMIHAAVAAGARGIVHAGVGMGRIHCDVLPALVRAVENGVTVVCSTRVGSGPVLADGEMAGYGFVTADTLNPQKARVLLQLALTKTGERDAVQKMFDTY